VAHKCKIDKKGKISLEIDEELMKREQGRCEAIADKFFDMLKVLDPALAKELEDEDGVCKKNNAKKHQV